MKQTAHSKLCNMNDSDRRDEISENDTTYICAHIWFVSKRTLKTYTHIYIRVFEIIYIYVHCI